MTKTKKLRVTYLANPKESPLLVIPFKNRTEPHKIHWAAESIEMTDWYDAELENRTKKLREFRAQSLDNHGEESNV